MGTSSAWSQLGAAAALALFIPLSTGCPASLQGRTAAPAEPAAAPAPTTPFSGERAWALLERLVAAGPRHPGSAGGRLARALIKTELDSHGYAVLGQPYQAEVPPDRAELEIVTGELSGESRGLVLFVAHSDTDHYPGFSFLGANDAASGVAVLLELARLLAAEPLPYDVMFAFIEGQSRFPPPFEDPALRQVGSRIFVTGLREAGRLPDVKLAVVVDQVGDADLAIGREILSHRVYRDVFNRAAARLGHGDAFSLRGAPVALPGPHNFLFKAGIRRLVTFSDPIYGGDTAPGLYAHSEDDNLAHCSAESLQATGDTILAGVREISQRLARLDRVRTPNPPPPSALPENDGAETPPAEGESAPAPEGDAASAETGPAPADVQPDGSDAAPTESGSDAPGPREEPEPQPTEP